MKGIEALITPSVLKWARQKAGLSVSDAALKIGRSEAEIEKWESGELRPTIPQLRTVSEKYKRSLAVFYLPEPPLDFDTLRDFRYLPDNYPKEFSFELLLMIRKIYLRLEWLSYYLKKEGAHELEFVGKASLDEIPEVISRNIHETLGITPNDQLECKTTRDALNLWINRTENLGINVCRQGGIECQEARGFVITDKFAPFIFLNTNDARTGQLFTLVHELAHIWLNQSGVSNLEGLDIENNKLDFQIEYFCNKVASEALIDRELFIRLWNRYTDKSDLKGIIEDISNKIKVSPESIARRLLEMNIISATVYKGLREYYLNRWYEFQRQQAKKNKGYAPPLLRIVLNNGKLFTRTIISAYRNGIVTGRDVSEMIGAQIKHFPKISSYAGMDYID